MKTVKINKNKGVIIISNGNVKDLTGKRFERLIVIDRANDYIDPRGKRYVCWNCECDCGERISVRSSGLRDGRTKSCGCYKRDLNNKKRKDNIYDLTNEYGIGYMEKTGNPFYFDLEDYDKISKYYWREDSNGYARACLNNKYLLMHRYVLNITDSNIFVDHRYHKNLDNRKSMLRPTTCHNNTMNKSISKVNTSGITGVSWEEEVEKWHSYIWFKGKTIHLGRFKNFNDAVKARKLAEDQYFGEFSYSNSMKGVENFEI